ncbi:ABC transporter permease subunit, partial [Mesorhizobium sp. M1C.F.Ca.ET.189.01.1.1]|uniref:ABC transporter permease subunit n=1 Tax=Mesorhizobium sp. M1C.F.Ca.ET.189.01.1.1 TaxID=2563925 RepID=UPI001091FF02
PNTITPTIQTIALNAAWLAGGVVVTESVFQLPGIGSALSDAVINRDMPTVLAITLIITATYVLINRLAIPFSVGVLANILGIDIEDPSRVADLA